MSNHIAKGILAMLALTALSSCATILHGSRQTVGISSNPSEAAVWLDNQYIGTTPLITQMTRKNSHIAQIELPGYQPYEIIFTRQLNGWTLGNFLIGGGIIGLAIDAATGAIYKLTPSQVQAEMRSNRVVHSKRSSDSHIAIVLKADPSWEKIGNLVAAK